MNVMKSLALFSLGLSAVTATATAQAAETRCGWLANPTPGNWWLTDADGTWTIGVQGGHQANYLSDLTGFRASRWVKVNGNYGYGCACLKVATNPTTKIVSTVTSGFYQDLSVCENDPALKP